MSRDRRSCSKGWYHHRWEDHSEECTILFSIYGCTFNLSSRSLFIYADLIRYIGKSIEKSSLRRYWWNAYHNTWCKGVFAADRKSHGIHLCFSPFSILFRHANLALDSRYSSCHIRQSKELTLHAHDECNVSDAFRWHICICKRSLNSLLFIVATIVPNPMCQGCSHPSTWDLFYASGDTLFDCYLASEVFLQRMMVLYVTGHYKNDLQPMSDASAYHLFVLLPPIKDDVWREGWGIWFRCWVLHNFNNISSVCWMGRE